MIWQTVIYNANGLCVKIKTLSENKFKIENLI